MAYELTLADLSIPDTKVRVVLRLHGCIETAKLLKMPGRMAFASWLGMGKLAGLTVLAPVPTGDEALRDYILADATRHEMNPADPMHKVANDYVAHQEMREYVRFMLASDHGRNGEVTSAMCALSAWLVLHDPSHANAMRQRTLYSFQNFNRAVITVACTANRAYVRHVGPATVNTNHALHVAAHSTTPTLVGVRPEDRFG